jgi:predicted DNA-binding transcriptional regulator AlpA
VGSDGAAFEHCPGTPLIRGDTVGRFDFLYHQSFRHPYVLIHDNLCGYASRVRLDGKTELVIAADIARRLGISKQRVGVLASGSGFPEPVGMLGRSQVWRWSSVERWARATARLPIDA